MSVSVKIPNLETQERIATAVEKIAGDYLKNVIKQQWLDMHPVGYIWKSFSSTDPSEIVGGTWQQLKDVSLVAAGDTFKTSTITTNQDGGEINHTLTSDEMPSHQHPIVTNKQATWWKPNWSSETWLYFPNEGTYANRQSTGNGFNPTWTGYRGGNQPHNNMGPYKVVYMWVRIA